LLCNTNVIIQELLISSSSSFGLTHDRQVKACMSRNIIYKGLSPSLLNKLQCQSSTFLYVKPLGNKISSFLVLILFSSYQILFFRVYRYRQASVVTVWTRIHPIFLFKYIVEVFLSQWRQQVRVWSYSTKARPFNDKVCRTKIRELKTFQRLTTCRCWESTITWRITQKCPTTWISCMISLSTSINFLKIDKKAKYLLISKVWWYVIKISRIFKPDAYYN
jgi:hypothetical protein